MEATAAAQQLSRLWGNTGLTFRTHAPAAPEADAAADAPLPSPSSSPRSSASTPADEEDAHYDICNNSGLRRVLGIVRGSKGAKTVVGTVPSASSSANNAGSSSRSSSPGPGRGKGRGRGRGSGPGRGRGRGRGQAKSQLASTIDKDGLLRAQQLLGPLHTLGRSGVKEKWLHPPSGIRVVVRPGELGLDEKTILRMERSQEYNDMENRARIIMNGVLKYRQKKEEAVAR